MVSPCIHMKLDLLTLDRKALELRNSGRLIEAVELLAAVVKDLPDWEHGSTFFNLACCYEELGAFALAEQCYRDALRYEPKNPFFLESFASFLNLQGDVDKAFQIYLALPDKIEK